MTPDPHASPPDSPHRSGRDWLILLSSYAVGMVSWALYIAAALYLFYRFLV